METNVQKICQRTKCIIKFLNVNNSKSVNDLVIQKCKRTRDTRQLMINEYFVRRVVAYLQVDRCSGFLFCEEGTDEILVFSSVCD